MMLPTHALAGMALALPLVAVAPELAPVALVAGLLGGILPDVDLYAGHRKTLHFPVYYAVAAVPASVVAVLISTPATVAVAFLLLGAALHSVADIFGSGLELRPWEGRSDRAVFDHLRGRWIVPRRTIRYDGSPEDLLASVALALPLLYTVEGVLEWLVVGALVVGVAYTALRRPLAAVVPLLVRLLPDGALPFVPDRYLSEDGGPVATDFVGAGSASANSANADSGNADSTSAATAATEIGSSGD